MKYIINEDNRCGAASLSDDLRNQVLESMGYTPNTPKTSEQINESVAHETEVEDNTDMPSLYQWDDAVFVLDEEVFEIEGDLFLKAIELDNGTRMSLDESHSDLFINEVRFEESPFSLGDIYDFGDEIFIKLDEGKKKGDKSKTHAGKDFDKDDEKGDPRAFGGKKGDKSKTHGGKDFEVNEVAAKLKKLKKKLKEDDEDGPSNADLDKIEKQQKRDGTY
tara:strand:+ start:51 stop:710 length:660 start_codon:yes stop_codon:yes gene_type:complete